MKPNTAAAIIIGSLMLSGPALTRAATDFDVDMVEYKDTVPGLINPKESARGKLFLDINYLHEEYKHDIADGESNSYTSFPLSLRYNLGGHFEWRLSWEAISYQPPVQPNTGNYDKWGTNDVTTGFKYHFLGTKTVDMALTPTVTFPAGSRQNTDGGVQCQADLSAMLNFGPFHFLLDAAPAYMHDPDSKENFWQANYGAQLSYDFTDVHNAGISYNGWTPTGSPEGTHRDRISLSYSYSLNATTSLSAVLYRGIGPRDIDFGMINGIGVQLF